MSGSFSKPMALILFISSGSAILSTALPIRAEKGFLQVQVKDVQDRPVSGLEIDIEGYGGPARTGRDGKARLPLGSDAAPGDPVTLTILRSPKGKDLAIFSPWTGKAQIPRFEDKPENYITLVVMNRGDRAALANGKFLGALTAKIDNRYSTPAGSEQAAPIDPKVALATIAKQYGYLPDDLDRAIRSWGNWSNTQDDFYEAGLFAMYKLDFPTASLKLQSSLAAGEEDLAAARRGVGEKEERVANAAFFLGSSLYAQGRYEESASAFRKYTEVRPDDPFVLGRTAISLLAAGDVSGAKKLTDQGLAIAKEKFAPDDLGLASALDSAGMTAEAMGDHSQAESLFQQAIDIDSKSQVPFDTNLAASLNNLGIALQSQQRYPEAELSYNQAIAINKKLFGPDNLEGASYRNNLAMLFVLVGRYQKAEQEFRDLLTLRESEQSVDHPQVAQTCSNLADVLVREKRIAEAEPYARRALDIDVRVFKPDSSRIGARLYQLAQILVMRGNYQEAESDLNRSLKIREMADGPESLEYGQTLNHLADVSFRLQKFPQAEEQSRRALDILQKRLPADDPLLALAWELSGYIFESERKYPEAAEALKEALSIAKAGLGPDHPTTKRIEHEFNFARQ
jgi:tetratricopeptide (TPR) repeat protein